MKSFNEKNAAIAAISTPQAPGGIGIVRISGADALEVASRIFRPLNGADITLSKGYRAFYGRVFENNEDIDEAVCLVFRAPKSYTGEDVAEISCHGGLFILKKVLSAVLASGARAAQAGEFTQRAFLNGRIDLSEAEAVMSLISAKGEQAAKAALSALDGALSREIRSCADELVSVSARLAAWVDYPDEEIEELSRDEMQSVFVRVDKRLSKMLNDFDMGQAATQGVDTVIAGRPNVGKSTLMNLLSGSDKSIVTSVAGTTRDIVEQDVLLGSVTLRLADTAGLRQTDDAVESIGVERAKKRVERAQLVLAVFDGSQELTDDDKELLALCRGTKTVGIINKNDLPQKSDRTFIEKNTDRTVEISALDRDAAQTLGDAVSKLLGTNDFDSSAALLANERQRDSCRRALEMIREAQTASKSGVTLDAVNVLVDTCIETLLEITGEKASETVVNEIFSKFCVGK